MNTNFSHAATVLTVTDMANSISFYHDRLGFDLTFTWENPVTYAVLNNGDIHLHLTLVKEPMMTDVKRTYLYIFVYDLQKTFEELKKVGVVALNELGARDYNMNDFDIEDPDGHVITFGKGN